MYDRTAFLLTGLTNPYNFSDRYFELSIWSAFRDKVKFYKFYPGCKLAHNEDVENNDIYRIVIITEKDWHTIAEVKITTADIIKDIKPGFKFEELLRYYQDTIIKHFNKDFHLQILKFYYYKLYDIYKKYVY